MKGECSKGLEQNLSVMQAISSLTSLSARINDMCGRTRLPEYSAIQAVLKGGTSGFNCFGGRPSLPRRPRRSILNPSGPSSR